MLIFFLAFSALPVCLFSKFISNAPSHQIKSIKEKVTRIKKVIFKRCRALVKKIPDI